MHLQQKQTNKNPSYFSRNMISLHSSTSRKENYHLQQHQCNTRQQQMPCFKLGPSTGLDETFHERPLAAYNCVFFFQTQQISLFKQLHLDISCGICFIQDLHSRSNN